MTECLYNDKSFNYGKAAMKTNIIILLDDWADTYPVGHMSRLTILRAIEKIEEEI